MKKGSKIILFIMYSIVASLLLLEIVLRVSGYQLLRTEKQKLNIVPGEKFFVADTILGFRHPPGSFKITINDSLTWHVTNNSDGYRLTHPEKDNANYQGKPEIWIFGCSFTYGWTVNDNESFPWLLQQKLPDYNVKNFGIASTGTLVSLLQLTNELKKGKEPAIVILAYASFHDQRNCMTGYWRKMLQKSTPIETFHPPFAQLINNKIKIEYLEKIYQPNPLVKKLAIGNLFEDCYFIEEDWRARRNSISRQIIIEMNEVCKSHSCKFIVAGISNSLRTKKMLDFCKNTDINPVDISVDLDRPGATNRPFDNHPSAVTQKKYADHLYEFLNNDIHK